MKGKVVVKNNLTDGCLYIFRVAFLTDGEATSILSRGFKWVTVEAPAPASADMGRRLRQYRMAHHISMIGITKELGISEQEYTDMERGLAAMPTTIGRKLAQLYGCKLIHVFGEYMSGYWYGKWAPKRERWLLEHCESIGEMENTNPLDTAEAVKLYISLNTELGSLKKRRGELSKTVTAQQKRSERRTFEVHQLSFIDEWIAYTERRMAHIKERYYPRPSSLDDYVDTNTLAKMCRISIGHAQRIMPTLGQKIFNKWVVPKAVAEEYANGR